MDHMPMPPHMSHFRSLRGELSYHHNLSHSFTDHSRLVKDLFEDIFLRHTVCQVDNWRSLAWLMPTERIDVP